MAIELRVALPIVEVDGTIVALTIDQPAVAVGTEVDLCGRGEPHRGGRWTIEGLFVACVDTSFVDEFAPSVLALFGLDDADEFYLALEKHGVPLMVRTPVTIYTLYDYRIGVSE